MQRYVTSYEYKNLTTRQGPYSSGTLYMDNTSKQLSYRGEGVDTPWHGWFETTAFGFFGAFDVFCTEDTPARLKWVQMFFSDNLDGYFGHDYQDRAVLMKAQWRWVFDDNSRAWTLPHHWCTECKLWVPSPPLRPPPNGFGGPQPLGQPPVLAIEEGAYDAEGASADAVANTEAYEEASADAAVADADAVAAGASANTTILSQGGEFEFDVDEYVVINAAR